MGHSLLLARIVILRGRCLAAGQLQVVPALPTQKHELVLFPAAFGKFAPPLRRADLRASAAFYFRPDPPLPLCHLFHLSLFRDRTEACLRSRRARLFAAGPWPANACTCAKEGEQVSFHDSPF